MGGVCAKNPLDVQSNYTNANETRTVTGRESVCVCVWGGGGTGWRFHITDGWSQEEIQFKFIDVFFAG